jgi:hypothetical protein
MKVIKRASQLVKYSLLSVYVYNASYGMVYYEPRLNMFDL